VRAALDAIQGTVLRLPLEGGRCTRGSSTVRSVETMIWRGRVPIRRIEGVKA
jgi:hypothetical protein